MWDLLARIVTMCQIILDRSAASGTGDTLVSNSLEQRT